MNLAKGNKNHQRSKHIDIRYRFVQENIENGKLKLEWISTDEMLADILTKPLPYPRFEQLRKALGMISRQEYSNVSKAAVGIASIE